MPFTLTMPKLSPTMEEGTIAKWHKKPGDFVESGDLLLEVATDKATVEHNALDPGWLRQILVQEGHDAIINQPIAIFSEKKEESIEGYKPEGAAPKAAAAAQPAAEAPPAQAETKGTVQENPKAPAAPSIRQPSFIPEKPLEEYRPAAPALPSQPGQRILASPLAKKIAKERGIDLAAVLGTGPGKRIMKKDVEAAQPSGGAMFARKELPAEMPGAYEEIPLNQMRKVIAQRLQEAKSFIPHFYVQKAINAEPLISLREQLKNFEVKVTFNDLMIKACALALREHPVVNGGFNSANNTLIRFKTIDIAVAVSVEGGLITPIVRYADFKNIGEIAAEVKSLAQRAKEGKLEAQEYKGGSFTVSNLGMYDVADFQAIINPPQACILAVSSILDIPVVRNGAVAPGKVFNVTLSSDHRVVDGVAAAEFLQTLQAYLENPAVLLL